MNLQFGRLGNRSFFGGVLMSIGYACLTLGVPFTDMKSCTLKNATDERLLEITAHNLKSLENIIKYNLKHDIKLFRISSDLIPFGSNPANKLSWWEIFSEEFLRIGEIIKSADIRVSMHPGQYTVLNSLNSEVVKKAVEDLIYHCKVLEALGTEKNSKVILHIGGVYGDKKEAIKKFKKNYMALDNIIKKRLVIENDQKSYNIQDVLEIGQELNIPVVFDNLHHKINQENLDTKINIDDYFWINECRKTWKNHDGNQKIHYSQQDSIKHPGAHSKTIAIEEFMEFYSNLNRNDIDIMLEVKDKNLSGIKCINCTRSNGKIGILEEEWSRYKYNVLEHSPNNYKEIRRLLKDKNQYPAVKFYNLIEDSFNQQATSGNLINGAQHVWGYFKDIASTKEKEDFLRNLNNFNEGKSTANNIKNQLKKLAVKHQRQYLLDSYYFTL